MFILSVFLSADSLVSPLVISYCIQRNCFLTGSHVFSCVCISSLCIFCTAYSLGIISDSCWLSLFLHDWSKHASIAWTTCDGQASRPTNWNNLFWSWPLLQKKTTFSSKLFLLHNQYLAIYIVVFVQLFHFFCFILYRNLNRRLRRAKQMSWSLWMKCWKVMVTNRIICQQK